MNTTSSQPVQSPGRKRASTDSIAELSDCRGNGRAGQGARLVYHDRTLRVFSNKLRPSGSKPSKPSRRQTAWSWRDWPWEAGSARRDAAWGLLIPSRLPRWRSRSRSRLVRADACADRTQSVARRAGGERRSQAASWRVATIDAGADVEAAERCCDGV